MKTPKRILNAIEKHERQINKLLSLLQAGKPLRGYNSDWQLDEISYFIRLAKMLKKNQIQKAVNYFETNFLSGIIGIPEIIDDYMGKLCEKQYAANLALKD